MYQWTLSAIRTKVRTITGYPSTAQMSNETLDQYINQAYQNELPRLLGHSQFNTWLTFDTVAGTAMYVIDDIADGDGADIVAIDDGYVTVDGYEVFVLYDRWTFFSIWPEWDYDEDGQPEYVLIEGRNIWLKPTPDDAYEVKIPVIRKCPAALSDSDDTPLDPSWGPIIAYIAAEAILLDRGRDVTTVEAAKKYYLSLANYDDAHRMRNRSAQRSF